MFREDPQREQGELFSVETDEDRAALTGDRGTAAPASPPEDESELLTRAETLAGVTLGELAEARGARAPPDLKRAKGWVGQIVEDALGATAKSAPTPDFVDLAIELKTIPLDARGLPRESTFVCSIPLRDLAETEWPSSRVKKKLARVLFIPIEADPRLELAERRVGWPLLWSPREDDEARLRADWESLGRLITDGYADAITAHLGECMQVRPKAAHSGVRTQYVGEDGTVDLTLPRGFYLRARYTASILARHYALPC